MNNIHMRNTTLGEYTVNSLMTVISTLELSLTSTPTLSAAILPVQVYCPLSEVWSGENTSLPLVTVPSGVRPPISILSPLGSDPSGPIHTMEMSSDLTPSTVSTTHSREKVSPAVEVPSDITLTSGWPRSGVKYKLYMHILCTYVLLTFHCYCLCATTSTAGDVIIILDIS